MLRNFAEDCEIHGVKQLVKADSYWMNRVCWAVVILASTACFITLASFRVMYFLTYPYITITRVVEDSYPIPSVALCATVPARGPPRLPIRVWQNQDALTDQEAVEFAWLHYKIDISAVDDKTGELVLDERSSFIISNTESDITSFEGLSETVFTNISLLQSIPVEEINAVTQRLKLVDTKFRVRITPENFYKNYGLKLDDVSCTRMQASRRVHNCTSQMFRMFTEIGSCIILDTTTTQDTQPNLVQFSSELILQNWADYIFIEINNNTFDRYEWYMVVLVSTPGAYPSWHYQSVNFIDLEGMSPQGIFVEKFEKLHKLGLPYRGKECVSETQSACVLKCFTEAQNCSQINSRHNFGYLPCPLPRQMWWKREIVLPEQLEKCGKKCANLCEKGEFQLKETMLVDYSDDKYRNDSLKLYIIASTSMTHVVAREEPLYTYDALLSEVGGTLGLFIGASVITLVYILQFVITVLMRKCMTKSIDGV